MAVAYSRAFKKRGILGKSLPWAWYAIALLNVYIVATPSEAPREMGLIRILNGLCSGDRNTMLVNSIAHMCYNETALGNLRALWASSPSRTFGEKIWPRLFFLATLTSPKWVGDGPPKICGETIVPSGKPSYHIGSCLHGQ